MTYYSAQELAPVFELYEGIHSQLRKIFPKLNTASAPRPTAAAWRRRLVHIAVVPRMAEQIHFTERRTTLVGFDFFSLVDALHAEEERASHQGQIVDLPPDWRRAGSQSLESATEDFLAQRVTYPEGMQPPSKTRFEMLLSLKEHEMHHRGQLMIVERMLGIVPHLTRDMQARVAAMRAGR